MLETPRLHLRSWGEDDRAPFAAMNADAQVMRFFAAPLTRAESDKALDRYNAQLAGVWRRGHRGEVWRRKVRERLSNMRSAMLGCAMLSQLQRRRMLPPGA